MSTTNKRHYTTDYKYKVGAANTKNTVLRSQGPQHAKLLNMLDFLVLMPLFFFIWSQYLNLCFHLIFKLMSFDKERFQLI